MSTGGVDDFRASFFEECDDLLEAMHEGFGLMQNGDDDDETIHVIFRAVHSVKGGAGAFGLDDLVAFAHHFETALELVRSGKIDITPEHLTLFQQCGDHLSDLMVAARDGASAFAPNLDLGTRLDDIIGAQGGGEKPEVSDAAASFEPMALDLGEMLGGPVQTEPVAIGHTITFIAEPELFSSGNEPALLFRALDRYGAPNVVAELDAVPPLSLLDPSVPYLTFVLSLETDAAVDVLQDVFDFVSDCARISYEPLFADAAIGVEAERLITPDTDEILPVSPAPTAGEEANISPEPPEPVEPAAAHPIVTPGPLAQMAATSTSPSPNAAKSSHGKKQTPQTIRVEFERVDKLINLVGELVIKEAMLSQSVAALDLATGSDVLLELESLKQLASEIQEGVMAIRAQPVKPLFQRMARTIRDASAMTGKRVRLTTKGESAEIDKTVLERLVDPLTHMVRNAVDHGLEDGATRLANGKPEEGTVTLSAAHRSGRVIIEIADDGAGINRPRVRQIAIEKGLIAEDATLSPSEIDGLLFEPGFSSKDEVSELSGRGVGLDVAKSDILALGGRLSIQSETGKGTVFSISLPLTLAVLEGMVVEVAGQTMVVPITAIQETFQAATAQLHTIGSDSRVLSVRDTLVPVADLGAIFGFRTPPKTLNDEVLLIIETETERRCALIVDSLQDQRQVVIKSLETNYGSISGVAAATILGDGRIALIVDPEDIAGCIVRTTDMAQGAASPETFQHHTPSEGGDLVQA